MLSPNESRLLTEKYKGLEYINLPIALAGSNFSLMYFNSTFSRLFQHINEALPVRDFNELFENFTEKLDILKQAGLTAGYLQNFIIPAAKLRNAERYFDLHVSKFSPEIDHLEGFSITCVEVTEREREINRLSEEADQHNRFLNHTTSGVILHQNRLIIKCNEQADKLLGAGSGQTLAGMYLTDFLDENSKNLMTVLLTKLKTDASVLPPGEFKIKTLDGRMIDAEFFSYPATFQGNPAIVSIFTDISERKSSEKKLYDSRQQYYTLVENLKDVIFQTDTAGRFTFLNASWKDLTGFTAEETNGKYAFDYLRHQTEEETFFNRIKKMTNAGALSMNHELKVKTISGDEKFVEVKFQVITDSNNMITGINGSIADIHARKLAQLELKNIEESLKQHNKVLVSLAKSSTIYSGDFSKALQDIAKTCANTLQASRVNIWQFNENYKILSCLVNYNSTTQTFTEINEIDFYGASKYFNYLLNDRILDVSDTTQDYRYAELVEKYCLPQNINAAIDVSIIADGKVWGVICFEQHETRKWTLEDQSFARSAAEFVNLAQQATRKQSLLKESEKKDELYRSLVEQANDAIYIIDTNDTLLEVNESACALTGYTREEMIGMPVARIFPKRFVEPGKSVLDKVRKEKKFTKERILLLKNGKEIITEISSVELPDGRIQGIARNITERKNQEKALKESETRLELALKGADLGTWDFFIQEDRIHHNKRWGEILGYNFEMDVMNEHFMDKFVHPDDIQKVYHAFQKHLRGETPYYEVTIRMLASNGEYKWIQDKGKVVEWDEQGNPVRASGIHQDVSALKSFEKEIQNQKNYLHQIIDAIPNPVYVKNINEEFVIVNLALANFLGVDVQSVMKYKSAQKPGLNKTLQTLFEKDTEVFISRKPIIIFQQEIEDEKTGTSRWLQSIKVPLKDNEGNYTELLSVSTDVTELKLKEHELAELNENLELKAIERTSMLEIANKELETFNFSVSHDLRTPLRTIDIFAYFLEKNYKDKLDKEGNDNIRQIRQSILKMSALIDNLVIYSRMGRIDLNLALLQPESLIRDVIEEVTKDQDTANVQFNITHLPQVYADSSMLRIVLQNLISNALKFTKNVPAPSIEFFGYVDEKTTTLSIRDNGVGFSKELKEKLFKPFKRLHSEEYSEGTGVGLAIVEKIIKRHNGQVWAESEENKGTTFYIKLPNK
jgi:PAS domain S-box-containing protein